MDKKYCKIVQDLLPNYIENLTSPETNQFIETHLKECKACEKSLEIMKKGIISESKKQSRQIDYLKRYKRKMIILKSVIGLVIIFILVFLGIKIYQWNLLSKIFDHNVEYEIGNNYKLISKNADGTITELFYKDGYCYYNVNNKGIIWEGPNSKYMIIPNDKTYLTLDKSTPPTGLADATITIGDYFLTDSSEKVNLFKTILTNNIDIHEEQYGEHQCYVILFGGQKLWIDKETLFIIRNDYNGQSTEFDIEIGTVTDDDVKMPDISEFTEIKN